MPYTYTLLEESAFNLNVSYKNTDFANVIRELFVKPISGEVDFEVTFKNTYVRLQFYSFLNTNISL